ncbi:hypothetical protein BDA96_01G115300 [Sorghum bicolor]|uniref:Uncharacterized protein n=1 Tax=Sorghum bicolor TaxID=4558 RepID=A0A921RX72_SORBI|nr:hypothetical protein BDA96_01G115300 [Sorghum bicolor]
MQDADRRDKTGTVFLAPCRRRCDRYLTRLTTPAGGHQCIAGSRRHLRHRADARALCGRPASSPLRNFTKLTLVFVSPPRMSGPFS